MDADLTHLTTGAPRLSTKALRARAGRDRLRPRGAASIGTRCAVGIACKGRPPGELRNECFVMSAIRIRAVEPVADRGGKRPPRRHDHLRRRGVALARRVGRSDAPFNTDLDRNAVGWATCERLAPACAARGCTRPRVAARVNFPRSWAKCQPPGRRRSRPRPDDLRQQARQATALRASADGRRNERHDRRVSTARFGTPFLWVTSPQTLSTRLHVRRRLAKSTPAGATCARGHSGSNTGSRGHRSQPAPTNAGGRASEALSRSADSRVRRAATPGATRARGAEPEARPPVQRAPQRCRAATQGDRRRGLRTPLTPA